MRTLLILAAIVSLADLGNADVGQPWYIYTPNVPNNDVEQIFYDGLTGLPKGYLSSPNESGTQGLYIFSAFFFILPNDISDPPALIGRMEGDDVLYDYKGLHSVGMLNGDYIYLNNGALFGFFKTSAPLLDVFKADP